MVVRQTTVLKITTCPTAILNKLTHKPSPTVAIPLATPALAPTAPIRNKPPKINDTFRPFSVFSFLFVTFSLIFARFSAFLFYFGTFRYFLFFSVLFGTFRLLIANLFQAPTELSKQSILLRSILPPTFSARQVNLRTLLLRCIFLARLSITR